MPKPLQWPSGSGWSSQSHPSLLLTYLLLLSIFHMSFYLTSCYSSNRPHMLLLQHTRSSDYSLGLEHFSYLYIHLVNSLTSSKVSAQVLAWAKVSKLYIPSSVFGIPMLFCFFLLWKVLKNLLKMLWFTYLWCTVHFHFPSLNTPKGQRPLPYLFSSMVYSWTQNCHTACMQYILN